MRLDALAVRVGDPLLERWKSVIGDLRILVDEDGQEWECIDTGPERGSYATYACRRRGSEEPQRQISVPRSWDITDPEVAKRLLRR